MVRFRKLPGIIAPGVGHWNWTKGPPHETQNVTARARISPAIKRGAADHQHRQDGDQDHQNTRPHARSIAPNPLNCFVGSVCAKVNGRFQFNALRSATRSSSRPSASVILSMLRSDWGPHAFQVSRSAGRNWLARASARAAVMSGKVAALLHRGSGCRDQRI